MDRNLPFSERADFGIDSGRGRFTNRTDVGWMGWVGCSIEEVFSFSIIL